MASFSNTPRVNSALLNEYRGKTVRLTCKIIKLNGDTAVVEASDQGQVDLHLNRESHLSDPYVEVIGKVGDDLSIKVLTGMDMGADLDLSVVDAVVKMMHAQQHDESS
ncbi:RPA3 [Phaffia rhodozyma]|uniref:RPA3 n=1 Tax=Phaffia rhodozyma TaxID=264483 RepID=A0A0F7SGC9_PHARH|nr:RPA3 [Phaffia rhodozyma]